MKPRKFYGQTGDLAESVVRQGGRRENGRYEAGGVSFRQMIRGQW